MSNTNDMNRETYKDIEIGKRNFRISKFDALTGSYIAYTLMSEALPMGLNTKAGIPLSRKEMKLMSKQDFKELQISCLNVCVEKLPGGLQPIFDESGGWAVIGIEHDTAIVLALTIQALMFNVKSFFDESLLTSLSEAFSTMSLPGSPI
jgi:hypothetical protein